MRDQDRVRAGIAPTRGAQRERAASIMCTHHQRPDGRLFYLSRSIPHIVLAFAAVETAGAHAAGLEICVRSRKGRDRCARAPRRAPCRRARRARRAPHGFPRDNPRLRLRETSKAREVVEIIVPSYDTPPSARRRRNGTARKRAYGGCVSPSPGPPRPSRVRAPPHSNRKL
jgi:hypothetical protein